MNFQTCSAYSGRSRAPSLPTELYVKPSDIYDSGASWNASYCHDLQPEKTSRLYPALNHPFPPTPTSPAFPLPDLPEASALQGAPLAWSAVPTSPSASGRRRLRQVELKSLDSEPKATIEVASGRTSKGRASRTPSIDPNSPTASSAPITKLGRKKKIASKLPPMQLRGMSTFPSESSQPVDNNLYYMQSRGSLELPYFTSFTSFPPLPSLNSSYTLQPAMSQAFPPSFGFDGQSSSIGPKMEDSYAFTSSAIPRIRTTSMLPNSSPLPALGFGHRMEDRADAEYFHRLRSSFLSASNADAFTDTSGIQPNSPPRRKLASDCAASAGHRPRAPTSRASMYASTSISTYNNFNE